MKPKKIKKENEDMPLLAIEEKINAALCKGFDVTAYIRGFRVTTTRLIYFYIDLIARKKSQEIELGFWPGMTSKRVDAENHLQNIAEAYPAVKISASGSPVLKSSIVNKYRKRVPKDESLKNDVEESSKN